jgi:HlyD family secretion protein
MKLEQLKTKKALVAALVALALALGILAWKSAGNSKDKEEDASKPKTATVTRGSLRQVVESTGRVVPDQEIEIKCKASGEVIKLPVDVSDTVKEGALLVQIDPEEEERSVKRAEAALAASMARLEQARHSARAAQTNLAAARLRTRAALESAATRMKEAEAALARARSLEKSGMASAEELEGAETGMAEALAKHKDARAAVDELSAQEMEAKVKEQQVVIAEAQVSSDTLSLEDARQRLEDTTVTSPIAGVVAERNVEPGQIIASGINNVGGGTSVMKLADLSRVFVLASVDESDIGAVLTGQDVAVMVDSYPDAVFPGKVVRVATKGVNTSNVVTFEVKVEVGGGKKALLKPEMTATVEILVADKKDLLQVPVGAVSRGKHGQSVTVAGKDGEEERRTVRTGITDGEMIEIQSGLAEGETVKIETASGQGQWQSAQNKAGDKARQDHVRMGAMGGGGPRR